MKSIIKNHISAKSLKYVSIMTGSTSISKKYFLS